MSCHKLIVRLIVVCVVVIGTGLSGNCHVHIGSYKKCAVVQPVRSAKYIDECSVGVYDHVSVAISNVPVLGRSQVTREGLIRIVSLRLRETYNGRRLRRSGKQDANIIISAHLAIINKVWRPTVNFIIHDKLGVDKPCCGFADISGRNRNGNLRSTDRSLISRELNLTSGKINPSPLIGPHFVKLLREDEPSENSDYDTRQGEYCHYSFKPRKSPPILARVDSFLPWLSSLRWRIRFVYQSRGTDLHLRAYSSVHRRAYDGPRILSSPIKQSQL
jgi:hypothetical protein